MDDTAIITLIDENSKVIGDFELPLKIYIGELAIKLLATLKSMNIEQFIASTDIKISFNNRILNSYETLYENEIWDGSFLKITD